MSDLVILGFDGQHNLRSLQKEYLIDLEDACAVERENDGKVFIELAVKLTAIGAATGGSQGALWGMLFGLLFLNPLAGRRSARSPGRAPARCRARSPTTASGTTS